MIYIVSGEPYQASQFVKELRAQKVQEGFEYYFFDTENTQEDFEKRFLELLSTRSLFNKNKIIQVRVSTYEFVKKFFEESFKKVQDNILIFFAPGQKKIIVRDLRFTIKHFEVPKGIALREFILSEFHARNIKPSSLLVFSLTPFNVSSLDLYPLINEIEKISLAPNMYKELLAIESKRNPFNLTDALARKDRRRVLFTLEYDLRNGEKPFDIVSRILWQLRVLLLVQSLKPHDSSLKLSLHPFVIQKARQALHFFSPRQLQKLYLKAISLYEEVLFSSLPSDLLLSRFFWQL